MAHTRRERFAAIVGRHSAPAGAGLWLRASSLVLDDGAVVDTWPDLTGGDSLTQATPSQRPVLRTGILNGRSVVEFDGADDILTASRADLVGTSRTVFIVARLSTLVSDTRVLYALFGSQQSHFYCGLSSLEGMLGSYSNGVPAQATVTSTDSAWTTSFSVFTYRWAVSGSNVAVRLRKNGIQIGSADHVNGAVAPPANLFLGNLSTVAGAAGDFVGQVAELVHVTQAMSDVECLAFEQSLGIHYGIAVAA